MLVDRDFSYHPQTHDCVWIYFYLKEENAWDIILELTKVDFFLDFFFFKYCISRARANICIYTRKLYNKANIYLKNNSICKFFTIIYVVVENITTEIRRFG